jgi:hypothetical protein
MSPSDARLAWTATRWSSRSTSTIFRCREDTERLHRHALVVTPRASAGRTPFPPEVAEEGHAERVLTLWRLAGMGAGNGSVEDAPNVSAEVSVSGTDPPAAADGE